MVLQVVTKAEYKLKPYPSCPYPGEWEGRVAWEQFSPPEVFAFISVFSSNFEFLAPLKILLKGPLSPLRIIAPQIFTCHLQFSCFKATEKRKTAYVMKKK